MIAIAALPIRWLNGWMIMLVAGELPESGLIFQAIARRISDEVKRRISTHTIVVGLNQFHRLLSLLGLW